MPLLNFGNSPVYTFLKLRKVELLKNVQIITHNCYWTLFPSNWKYISSWNALPACIKSVPSLREMFFRVFISFTLTLTFLKCTYFFRFYKLYVSLFPRVPKDTSLVAKCATLVKWSYLLTYLTDRYQWISLVPLWWTLFNPLILNIILTHVTKGLRISCLCCLF